MVGRVFAQNGGTDRRASRPRPARGLQCRPPRARAAGLARGVPPENPILAGSRPLIGAQPEPWGAPAQSVPSGSPAPDSDFDSNRDSNGGGRRETEWTPVESRAAPTPCPVYVPGRRWTSVEPR